jgi:hypothetical protein
MMKVLAIIIIAFALVLCDMSAQTFNWRNISGNLDGKNEPEFVVTSTSHLLFCHETRGVFRSGDGGRIWGAANRGLENTRVCSVQPGDRPGEALCCTFDGRLYASTNDGSDWSPRAQLPADSMRLHHSRTGMLYAWSKQDGIYRSADGGTTWTRSFRTSFSYDDPVAIASDDVGRVYVGTRENGVYRSTDQGVGWERVVQTPLMYQKVRVLADTAVYAWEYAPNPVIRRSSDFGTSWQKSSLPGGISDLAADGEWLYYYSSGFRKSNDDGISSIELFDLDGLFQVIARVAPDTILCWRRDERLAMATRNGAHAEIVLRQVKNKERYGLSPDGVYYAEDQYGVVESHDSGMTWQHRLSFQLNPREHAASDDINVGYCIDVGQDVNGIMAAIVLLDSIGGRSGSYFATKLNRSSPWHLMPLMEYARRINSPKPGVFDISTERSIFRSSDLGAKWFKIADAPSAVLSIITFLSLGDSLLVIRDPVYVSTNLGWSWSTDDTIQQCNNMNPNSITWHGTSIILKSWYGDWYTADSGRTWLPMKNPQHRCGAFCVDSAGRILSGGDGGVAFTMNPTEPFVVQRDSLYKKTVSAMCAGAGGWIIAGVYTGTYITRVPGFTSAAQPPSPPTGEGFALHAPYPNPFIDAAMIPLTVIAPGHITMDVFDRVGRRVWRIADRAFVPGHHILEWHGESESAGGGSPGVYVIRCVSERSVRTAAIVRFQ